MSCRLHCKHLCIYIASIDISGGFCRTNLPIACGKPSGVSSRKAVSKRGAT